MWGELAWQLGGREAYAMVAEPTGAAPTRAAALRDLLAAYAPCLILIDEWVAYARQLWRPRGPAPAGTFDTQFTFAQSLTEASSRPGRAAGGVHPRLARPASATARPAAGARGRRRRRAGGARAAPARRGPHATSGSRRRSESLRDRPPAPLRRARRGGAGRHRGRGRQFVRALREARRRVPAEVRERRTRTGSSAPTRSTRSCSTGSTRTGRLGAFQRTRGVLRLMATVVHALWARDAAR